MKTSATEDDESGDEQRRIDACQGGVGLVTALNAETHPRGRTRRQSQSRQPSRLRGALEGNAGALPRLTYGRHARRR